ncbi:hypothetical protein HAZT_HAZT003045 [Hyalella azteca]|uniref:Uncharacterized protein n=1 Tax=Hyalella azteca TaxID=294128 RepID=A0A6A0HEC7_HYAAZ|nr:hypothetical protein HAZT_HAZT003045 [Hyalella azteca]
MANVLIFVGFAACVRQQQYCYSTAQEEASEPSSSNSPSSLSGELHQFQAETRMLLDIVAKSLYSDKEVFVRELVSNASDAIEKASSCKKVILHAMQARYESVQGKGAVLGEKDLRISISTDKYNKTLTIQDSGIGMTKEELISNLGTIARSGSKV